MIEQFKQDVKNGLSSHPKSLPSKYFYDEIGDELFVQIMNLQEYYLTDCEMEIFSQKTNEIITNLGVQLNTEFDLIELGPGDGTKTIHLLKVLSKQKYNFTYHPVDISNHALDGLEQNLLSEIPKLSISKQQGDYFNILSELKKNNKQKIILFLGSNIGNFVDDKAKEFINTASTFMNPGDSILLGIDLIKPQEIVLPAYSDKQGITAKFNLNLLDRINNELDADFNRENFYHKATYNETEGIARSYIVSKSNQQVTIKKLDLSVEFVEDEKIQTEVSRKYNDEILSKIIKDSQLDVTGKIMDHRGYFADIILTKRNS